MDLVREIWIGPGRWIVCEHILYVVSRSGLSVLQRILDTAAERTWQVTSVNLDTLTEAAFIKLLADLDYKKDFQIIIDCELERLSSILNLVKVPHWTIDRQDDHNRHTSYCCLSLNMPTATSST